MPPLPPLPPALEPGVVWLQEVMRLGPTMYFGELALLRGEPRAATVVALTDTSVLMLAREDFNILLGPLQLLLGQNAALYGPTATGPGVKQASLRVSIASAAEEHNKADQGCGYRRQLCMPLESQASVRCETSQPDIAHSQHTFPKAKIAPRETSCTTHN